MCGLIDAYQLRVRTPADQLYPQEWDDWVKLGLPA